MKVKMTIGRRFSREGSVCTVAEALTNASNFYCTARNQSGEGASTFPKGKITVGGNVYTISYNGRIWQKDGSEVLIDGRTGTLTTVKTDVI